MLLQQMRSRCFDWVFRRERPIISLSFLMMKCLCRTCPYLIVLIGLICITCLMTERVSAQVPTGLVAAYSFDEGSGTTVIDASGNGNTGTIVAATWAPNGRYGYGLSFNGANSYVNLG